VSISTEDIERLARLARIALAPGEVAGLHAALERVLALIEHMRSADTTSVEPMAHPLDGRLPAAQRLRADEAVEEDRRDDYQAVAPAVEGGLYLVPKVIE